MLDACGHDVRFDEYPIGAAAIRRYGTPLPDGHADADACTATQCCSARSATRPSTRCREPSVPRPDCSNLRRALGAFANLRPARCEDALVECHAVSRRDRTWRATCLIVRELLGGLYFGEPRGWKRR